MLWDTLKQPRLHDEEIKRVSSSEHLGSLIEAVGYGKNIDQSEAGYGMHTIARFG